MAEHKDILDTSAHCHTPQAFAAASNSTILTKDESGNLEWRAIVEDLETDELTVAELLLRTQTPQTLTGAGAVDITSTITHVDTTGGAAALTLVDGTAGQEKFLVMTVDAGAGTLTPTSLGNGTTITFDNVGDSAHLLFTNSAWHFMGGTATLA